MHSLRSRCQICRTVLTGICLEDNFVVRSNFRILLGLASTVGVASTGAVAIFRSSAARDLFSLVSMSTVVTSSISAPRTPGSQFLRAKSQSSSNNSDV